MAQLVGNGVADFSPNRPPSFLPHRFQKPEIPSFSVPEVSMISDDLNSSKISKHNDRAPFPPHGPFNRSDWERNLASTRPDAGSTAGFDRRSSDGGVSVASSSGSSSSSSGKRILPPPISRRSSYGHSPASPINSTAPVPTPISSSALNPINAFSHSKAFASHADPSQSPPSQTPRGRNAASSTSSAVPQRLVDAQVPHQRARSTPIGGLSPVGIENEAPNSHRFGMNGNSLRPREGFEPHSGDSANDDVGCERREKPRQISRPIHELLPETERPSQGQREPISPPTRVPESRFDADGSIRPSDGENTLYRFGSPVITATLSQPNVITDLFQHDGAETNNSNSQRPTQPDELKQTRSEDDANVFPKPESQRADAVHPVVLEMLRMQEANIRLLQEQVMYLMRRQSEGSCCCERRRSGCRRYDEDADDAFPKFRHVGTNVRTSFRVDDESSGSPTDRAERISGSETSDAEKVKRFDAETEPGNSTPDRRSSTSHSGKSASNEGVSSEPPSTLSSSRLSSRPSATPSGASSPSSSHSKSNENKKDGPKPSSPQEKSVSSPNSARSTSSPTASPTTKGSPASRGDFSQLSSPRFGESATMIMECSKNRDAVDLEAGSYPSTGQSDVNRRRESQSHVTSEVEVMPPSQKRTLKEEWYDEREPASADRDPSSTSPPPSSRDETQHSMIGTSAENTSIFLPKINYVTLMLGRETESSGNMESLALKYLKDDELAELAGISPRSVDKCAVKPSEHFEDSLTSVVRNESSGNPVDENSTDVIAKNKNFSFATKKYLMKYGLINERSVSFVVPNDKDRESPPEEGLVRGADPSRNADTHSTSSSSSSSPSRRSNMVLDLHKIQHLPKLT